MKKEDHFMDYEQFKIKYRKAFKNMMKYTPEQAGAKIYADELAELAEEHPEFEDALEQECCDKPLAGE